MNEGTPVRHTNSSMFNENRCLRCGLSLDCYCCSFHARCAAREFVERISGELRHKYLSKKGGE